MSHILIIEDEAMLREVYADVLKLEGHEVETAADGEEGIRKLPLSQPDLILLDILMPKVDGISFLKKVNLPKRYPHTKVLALSNLSDLSKLDDLSRLGATQHILKSSLSPKELVHVINDMLGVKQSN